jgi:hypothetical protein
VATSPFQLQIEPAVSPIPLPRPACDGISYGPSFVHSASVISAHGYDHRELSLNIQSMPIATKRTSIFEARACMHGPLGGD